MNENLNHLKKEQFWQSKNKPCSRLNLKHNKATANVYNDLNLILVSIESTSTKIFERFLVLQSLNYLPVALPLTNPSNRVMRM